MTRVTRLLRVGTLIVLLSEAVHYFASRRLAGISDMRGATTAVIVLGYGIPRSVVRKKIQRWRVEVATIQRWRVEIAVRTLAVAGSGCVIFSGSADVGGAERSEAEEMAEYAMSALGLDRRSIRLESNAAHTWQNVAYSLRLAESCDRIAIASDPLHAARATSYAARQRPDLAPRLCAADTYRLFERWWLKPPVTVYEGWRWLRDRGFERQENRNRPGS